ncbi:MAG: iron-siderophore ABC transporter substrate-binding protein [Candidatus Pristimantibacillus lignocellulolyticus]|uniref:Iron-siderophore ABC transporter substrate-binding protein n=1 Tax=Candidatus Pristimantibacillus lignocellulolyticus TaxID=2994561 RepID=A0A9J6Z8S7_9BACL|nr:MAG: iron-siderophore ABC transporter substrate-binding protein [Candidatus Pristimantibacillus lignocellulolyticus]
MKKRMSLVLFVMLSVVMVLSACGNAGNGATEPANSGTQTEQSTNQNGGNSTEQTSEEPTKREITHALGTTTIEGKPQRIVTLFQGATDTLVQFDITPVGVVESWAQQPMYDYLKDDLQDVTYVGLETQPNLEEISALKPDLIIATQVRHEEIYEQLTQIAPTVVTSILYDFRETANIIGQSIGDEDTAKTLIADWDTRVADFKSKVSGVEGWPLSASVVNFRDDHARIYVTGFAGSILTELGFNGPKDLTGDDHEIVRLMDKESIPNMNADVTFEFFEDTEIIKKTHAEWTSHPLYQNLDSAKNNQVYKVDDITWNFAGGLKSAHLMLDSLYTHFGFEQ